jgi:hypothetical protein
MIIFALTNLIFPVLGAFFSCSYLTLLLGGLFLIKAFFGFNLLTLGIPTLVATVFLNRFAQSKYKNTFFNEILLFGLAVLLPLISIFLFIVHPVGKQAYLYSFYWFIPVVCYLLHKLKSYSSLFSQYLIATFLAHAVGSIMCLYGGNLTSLHWMNLIPVVAFERLLFAGVMFGAHLFIKNFILAKGVVARRIKEKCSMENQF